MPEAERMSEDDMDVLHQAGAWVHLWREAQRARAAESRLTTELAAERERAENRERLIFEGGYNWGWADGLAEHYGESHDGIMERFERWKTAHQNEIIATQEPTP